MNRFQRILTLTVVLLFTLSTAIAQEQGKGGSDIAGGTAADGGGGGTKQLERCASKLGTLAVTEPQDFMMKALAQFSLPSPTQMIRLIVQQSGCFAVVERGVAMQNVMQERALADRGQLRANQNMGQGQMVTADYVLTPDVMFKNNNAGGLGGIGALFGPIGALVAGSIKFKNAQVTLTMADTRSGLQVAAATGSAQSADFGIGGAIGGAGGALGLGAYENTAEGKVVATAFLDAYNQLVKSVQSNPDLVRNNATIRVGTAGRDAPANPTAVAKSGDLGHAKIANIAVYKDADRKAIAFKLTKNEEVVILSDGGALLEVQGEKGAGWVDGRMISR